MTKSDEFRKCLVERAKNERTIPYGELGEKVGLGPRDLDVLLDSVCDWSKKKCGVLLSILVVRGDTKRPGAGFFKKHKPVDDVRDQETFFTDECDCVFQAAKAGKLDSL